MLRSLTRSEAGCDVLVPAAGLVDFGVDVGEAALCSVDGEVDGVGVGDDVFDHGAGAGGVDLLVEEVVMADPRLIEGGDSRRRRAGAWRRSSRARCRQRLKSWRSIDWAVGAQTFTFNAAESSSSAVWSRSSSRSESSLWRNDDAELAGVGVEVVEDACVLHAGGVGERAVGAEDGDGELAFEQCPVVRRP